MLSGNPYFLAVFGGITISTQVAQTSTPSLLTHATKKDNIIDTRHDFKYIIKLYIKYTFP